MAVLGMIHVPVGVTAVVLLLIAAYLVRRTYALLTDPLRDIPGPIITRFSSLWLFQEYTKGSFHKTNIKLHERYGPIVRIAPNEYSVDSPEALKIIYGHGTDFVKGAWYIPWGQADPKMKNLFNEDNPHTHRNIRRQVAAAYSMSNLISYEPCIDECTTQFVERLSGLATSGVVVDMGHWFQCYAFESVGMITFSKRMGFLERGEDIHGIMKQLEGSSLYSTAMGIFPSWHWLTLTCINYLSTLAAEPTGILFLEIYIKKMIASAQSQKPSSQDGPSDFITKFLAAQRTDPSQMTDKVIFTAILANVFAGSDTTSVALSAILYHLLKNPKTMEKLRAELDSASRDQRISSPVTFKEAQELPYLQAVIKEGLRIHPSTGFPMPRIVPKDGREIMGRYFPEGTTLGINSWVAHHNRDVFGDDAHLFNPERWLLDKESYTKLDAYFLSFGAGSRTCLGKNVSLLEISKVLPEVLRCLDFELENEREWNVRNHWFTKPTDFMCRIKKRSKC